MRPRTANAGPSFRSPSGVCACSDSGSAAEPAMLRPNRSSSSCGAARRDPEPTAPGLSRAPPPERAMPASARPYGSPTPHGLREPRERLAAAPPGTRRHASSTKATQVRKAMASRKPDVAAWPAERKASEQAPETQRPAWEQTARRAAAGRPAWAPERPRQVAWALLWEQPPQAQPFGPPPSWGLSSSQLPFWRRASWPGSWPQFLQKSSSSLRELAWKQSSSQPLLPLLPFSSSSFRFELYWPSLLSSP